jgi:hypothetical protein
MNALGELYGSDTRDLPVGQLGKAHDGPDATVLAEYRGNMSSIESVGDGVYLVDDGELLLEGTG